MNNVLLSIIVMTIFGLGFFIGLIGLSFFIKMIRKIIEEISIRKLMRMRKKHLKIKEEKYFSLSNTLKSHKLAEYVNEGFTYCDFCGIKLFDGKAHDMQECLIKSYKEVIIE